MNSDVWQSLLNLESRDIVSDWFSTIHGRQLNARRAKEIIASARQGREYFRSASTASFAVRPLLAFYGSASLCRAFTLLHRRDAGEEGLTQGHGLEAVAWATTLSGDISAALASINKLRVRACRGLFSDLVSETEAKRGIRIYDRTVFLPPSIVTEQQGKELAFEDILDRLPDISRRGHDKSLKKRIRISDLVYAPESGVKITVYGSPDDLVCREYAAAGYHCALVEDKYSQDKKTVLHIEDAHLRNCIPQILDTRIARTISGNPSPYLTTKFFPDIQFSQIAVTYMLSFILGMLARYFPTQWNALMGGEKGDSLWPRINAAQTYIETALPELIVEAIANSIYPPKDE